MTAIYFEDEEPQEPECTACNGTGLGPFENTVCQACKGECFVMEDWYE